MPSLMVTSAIVNGTVSANLNTVLGNPWDEQRSLAGFGTESIAKPQGDALLELSAGGASAQARAWRGAFAADGHSGFEFTLTPHTHVVFSEIADLDVANNPATPPDSSEAEAGLIGEIVNFPGQRTQFDSVVRASTPGSSSRSIAVHAYTGDFAGTGFIRSDARAFAIGVSPIPEPPPWALLLAGLALGGSVKRVGDRFAVRRCPPAAPAARAA